jgi:hypothetical protein
VTAPPSFYQVRFNALGGRRGRQYRDRVNDAASRTLDEGGHPCRWCGAPTPMSRFGTAFSVCSREHRELADTALAAAQVREERPQRDSFALGA